MQSLMKAFPSKTLALILSMSGLLLVNGQAQAQMYKWVGPNGKVVYSDTPPPANAKKLASKNFETNSSVSTANLPPELAAVVSKNPVVLYTAPNCGACNEGRNLLRQAGIPFIEKTVKTNEDVDKLMQVSGDTALPYMQINQSKFKGLESNEWRAALTAAGYPETSKLPKDYRYPDPEPAAPPVPGEKKNPDAKPQEAPKPKSTSSNGIRF